MIRNHKKMMLVAMVAAIIAIAVPVAAFALPASQAAPNVSITGSATEAEIGAGLDQATFQFFVTSSEALSGAVVMVSVPQGTTLSSSYVGQPGQGVGTVAPGAVVWQVGDIAANQKVGPFAIVVTYAEGGDMPTASLNLTWTGPTAGTANSAVVSPPEEREVPIRGCLGCHEPGSRYNLNNEATGHAKNVGLTHPAIKENSTFVDCMTCHGPGEGARIGLGKGAQLSLRDIVHPGHLYSSHFDGNCFSCHNVDESGNWRILSDNYKVNIYGMPENSPIGGWAPTKPAGQYPMNGRLPGF